MRTSSIIAIVDDDPGVRGSLDSLMRSAGITPRCFASAEELLGDPAAAGLCCILADIHMPGMTGLALQAELVRRGWPQPMILMTAHPTDAARQQAMAGGAAAFLTKPIDPDALLEAIASAAM
ncbi:response regulator transcription factor [Sphingomonas soli]|uniref:response regulator transcription factor n=1 Tax=Sphingomonas soli TaxID=266127 RepID=UPI00082EE718|nr:response regulator [Sphingomonas soli]